MALNIKTRAARDTDTVQLRDGNDELLFDGELPVSVTVYGPGSKQYQAAAAAASSRALERMRKRGGKEPAPEIKRKETAEHLAAITVGFDNLDYDGLKGQELALAVFSDPTLGYIADQVNRHAADWANFTKAS